MENDSCQHPTDFNGLCTECGQDVSHLVIDRPFLLHKGTMIRGSNEEARRLEKETVSELLANRRLSLIIDLDQTLLHSTIDPQVEKMLDLSGDAATGRIHKIAVAKEFYYVKFRPGVELFLAQMHEFFQLHVYTMGNREYADHIVAILDPNATYFGDRVLTRDDNIIASGSTKSLKRIFPHSDSTVLVIDDRGDVWDWCDNLVLVEPFVFFISLQQKQDDFVEYSYVAEKIKSLKLSELQDTVLLEKIAPALRKAHHGFFSLNNNNDIKNILKSLKHQVLKDYKVCFSSSLQPTRNKFDLMVASFGGLYLPSLEEGVSVFISNNPYSVGAIEARDMGIPVVSFKWLLDSTWRWQVQDPWDYLLDLPNTLSKSASFTSIDQNILEACNQEIEEELESNEENSDQEAQQSSKRQRLDISSEEDDLEISSNEIDELLEEIEQETSTSSLGGVDNGSLDWVT
jgi:FCP1-like phosphatase family protein